jgi:hypothetical protein
MEWGMIFDRNGIFFLLQNTDSDPVSLLVSVYWELFLWDLGYLILVLKVTMSGAIPLLPHMLSWH